MSGELHDAVQLLVDVGQCPDERVTQSQALDSFCLESSDLHGLHHAKRENKQNPKMPIKLFNALDVAQRALEVHGGAGRGLAATRARMQELQEGRRAAEQRREQVKSDMAARSAKRAELFIAITPAQRLCKRLHLDPKAELPKTKAKEHFQLEDHHLHGLGFAKKPNPRNPKFAPMRLYKAEEVAARALQYGTVGSVDEPKTPQ